MLRPSSSAKNIPNADSQIIHTKGTCPNRAPFYIKIDVEGYELKVLQGMRRAVPYLSFEVNLPEFRSEGLECIEQLRRMSPCAKFNYAVDCPQGLALTEWIESAEFVRVLSTCEDKSIEVFCKSPST